MKQVLSIMAIYVFFCLGVCLSWAFFAVPIIPILLPNTVVSYKMCMGLELFCSLLPAALIAGFCVSLAIAFGRGDNEEIQRRFSPYMFEKYKTVIAVSLICVAILTAAAELGRPLIAGRKVNIARQETLARDYERSSGNMYRAGNYDLAYKYAKLALDLDERSETAKALLNDSNIQLKSLRGARDAKKQSTHNAVSEEGFTVKELRSLAENAYKDSRYFDAHYYAQTALNIAEARDTSKVLLQNIATESWNKLERPGAKPMTEEERLYALKLSGYGALMSFDNLKAYYIFMSLSRISRKMKNDPDVIRYLEIAQERLEKSYFFIDEMLDKADFETAHNVSFSLKHKDGTQDIIHIKGIVSVKDSSGIVQYLRGFTMLSLDNNGNMIRKLYDDNVKMLGVSSVDLPLKAAAGQFSTEYASGMEGIDRTDAKTVPYLLLRSVDRYNEAYMNGAQCTFPDGTKAEDISGMGSAGMVPSTLILPMPLEDFELLKETSKGAELMDIASLVKMIMRADEYGYSSEVLSQIMLGRILYPMLILCLLMFLSAVSWNFSTKKGIPFQMGWVLSLPILTAMAAILMQVLLYLYRLMNHVFVSITALYIAPVLAILIYIAIFIISSVIFLARNNLD